MGQGSIGAPSVVVGALEPVSDTYLRFLEEYAEHEGGWAPRVLLTVFLRDRPGILLAVLETLWSELERSRLSQSRCAAMNRSRTKLLSLKQLRSFEKLSDST